MKKELKLVKIDCKYCDYLRKYDSRVPYNFADKEIRPFVGVLFEVGECKYFAPLSSPKPKHLKMKNTIDFFKLDNGKLGAVNFNNMVPVMENNVIVLDLDFKYSDVSKEKYQKLLKEQIYFLTRNKNKLYSKSYKLYDDYVNGRLNSKIAQRCCDFKLLELKCFEYNKN